MMETWERMIQSRSLLETEGGETGGGVFMAFLEEQNDGKSGRRQERRGKGVPLPLIPGAGWFNNVARLD